VRHRLLLLTALLILAPVAAVGCDRGGEEESAPSSPPAEPAPPAAQPPPAELGDPAAGGAAFANAGCGGCHTLEAADSSGSLGPNLDDLKPSFDRVVSQVTSGGGGMPAFGDQLSEQEILDVAAFVVRSTGG
jgi:mono/diheme cytochrome c family protein